MKENKSMGGFKILVIDGQGGGLGKAIVEEIKKEVPGASVTAAGTNTAATAAMLKAGADIGATGENAVIFNSKTADIITGSVGIGFANSMHGEITPKMAAAVFESQALKLLIPVVKCNAEIVGAADKPMGVYVAELASRIKALIPGQ